MTVTQRHYYRCWGNSIYTPHFDFFEMNIELTQYYLFFYLYDSIMHGSGN